MFVHRFLLSLGEFFATAVLAIVVVYFTYRAMIRTNTDFDEDDQLRQGNLAVGILVFALLVGSANIIKQGFSPVVDALHDSLTAVGAHSGVSPLRVVGAAIFSLALTFGITVYSLSFSLRAYGKFTTNIEEGKLLHQGNLAVGIVLSSVVLIVSMMIGPAVGSLAKALTPRASVSRVQIMR